MTEDTHIQNLTNENARLRLQLATVEEQLMSASAQLSAAEDERDKFGRERDSLARRCAVRFEETERLRIELAITTDQLSDSRAMCDGHVDPRDLAEALRQRDAAVAEAAVLRRHDRRTQAVVEAAETWFERMGERHRPVRRQEGSVRPSESTEPAEQAQSDAQPTDGWEYAMTRGPRKAWDDADLPPPGEGWERDPDRGHPGEGWERFEYHEESYWRRPPTHAPRVWKSGDPEPEGVEKVRDKDGAQWSRRGRRGWRCDELVERAVDVRWDFVLTWAPLTEVLPDPTNVDHLSGPGVSGQDVPSDAKIGSANDAPDFDVPVFTNTNGVQTFAANDTLTVTMDNTGRGWLSSRPVKPVTFVTCDCSLCATARRMYAANHPDGVVPEAGRAGEAQEQDDPKTRALADAEQAERIATRADPIHIPFWLKRATDKRAEAQTIAGIPLVVDESLPDGVAHIVDSQTGAKLGEFAVPAEDQDRTEGLDAAIEAAWRAYRDASGPAGHFPAIKAAVRIVAPLIERAALLAAADAVFAASAEELSSFPGRSSIAKWLRDRASRTVTA